jgi:hypothetical protein
LMAEPMRVVLADDGGQLLNLVRAMTPDAR